MRELKEKCKNLDPTAYILKNKLSLYTALPSRELFDWILKIMRNHVTEYSLSSETQLLMVLMKLKLNLLHSDIAARFQTSPNTVTRVFDRWIPILAGKLRHFIRWPTKRALEKHCPTCFLNSEYSQTVCTIDCTEVPVEKAGNSTAKKQFWSNYKHTQTIKLLVGTTPSGHISFVSEAWGGLVSDTELTLESGFLENIRPGDVVLADRGFILDHHFTSRGAKLVVPPFLKGRKQLPKTEVHLSQSIAHVRIHVERVIKQIKRFRILHHGPVPISFLKYIDSVIILCAALSNLSSGIVK